MYDRQAPKLELLEERFPQDSSGWEQMLDQSPGSYVGQSTCNNFTSALGAGQRVLSYSYYRPGVVASSQ